MDIGFCGIGRMGAAIVARLMDQGHRLTLWNRTEAKARPLIERGARWASSPAAVVAGNDVIIAILTDSRAIEAVYDGPQGLLAGDVAGKLFIDMSTLAPDTVERLAGRVGARGAALVECPVGGTVGPAREGKLLGLAGGAPADVARARPILDQLCRRLDHLGPAGTAAAMKLAINLPLIVYWEALGEAMSLCRDAGIEPARMIEIMTESSGGTNALRGRGAKIVQALSTGASAEVGFDIDGVRKDLRLMSEVALGLGVEIPVASRALECYDAAAAEGWGDRDGSSLAVYRLERAKAAKR